MGILSQTQVMTFIKSKTDFLKEKTSCREAEERYYEDDDWISM